ncbi:MAG TPA: nuclear transport factor 2 family protein [Stellaceae bacterium]|nr:nuclear transport factor 2 family protein [Stellaceae bacterium]
MTQSRELIERVYARFNARDINGVLTAVHSEVEWANGLEGGHVRGHEGIREYWERQWAMIDPHVEPTSISVGADGQIVVEVRQTVRDLTGRLFGEEVVRHVFRIKDGLIRRFDIRGV